MRMMQCDSTLFLCYGIEYKNNDTTKNRKNIVEQVSSVLI